MTAYSQYSQTQPSTFRLGERFTVRPFIILCAVAFFLVATPFELQQSGYAYLLKLAAVGMLLGYACLMRKARIGQIPIIPAVIILIVLILNTFGEFSDRGVLAVFVMAASLALGLAKSTEWNNDLKWIVGSYLFIHVAVLLFTLAVYVLLGTIIDPHGAIFPNEGRAGVHGAFARLAGLHNEPGTYSQWMTAALLFYALITQRFLGLFTVIVACSTLVSLSVWALVLFAIVLTAAAIDIVPSGTKQLGEARQKILAVLLGGFAIAGFFYVVSDTVIYDIYDFVDRKLSFETESGYYKSLALEFFYATLPDVIFIGAPITPGFCPNCLSPQDAGVGVNSIYYFGLIPAVLLFMSVGFNILRNWGMVFFILFVPLLVWKAHFYDPLLWIMIGYIIRGRRT